MHSQTVYTKTAKGVLEIKSKTVRLPRDLGLVFLAVDGKSTVADLAKKSGVPEQKLLETLDKLAADGYIKVFSPPVPSAAAASSPDEGGLDLDFTSPEAVAKLNVEAEVRARAEAEARARAQAAARATAEAKVRQETQARARAMAEAKMKVEAEAKSRAEAAAQAASEARAKAEAEARAAADSKARAEAEARVQAAMEAKSRAEAEAHVRADAEARARQEAEAKAAGETRAKEETEARVRAETEARTHAEAETRARTAIEAQLKAMAEALAQAEARAREEAAARLRMEAEIKARAIAEAQARAEAEARAKAAEEAVAQARAMAEAAAAARAEAEARIREQASDAANTQAIAHMEETMKALDEAKARAHEEAKARVAAEAKAQEEAEARKREEALSKAREETARRQREEAEAAARKQLRELREQSQRAREEAEARAEIEKKAREEAEEKTRAELSAKIEIEKKAREEAERQTEIARKAREEAEHRAREAGSANSETARKALADAEAAARAAEAALAQAQAVAEAERKARAEAEDRAKAETVARVMQEQQMRKQAGEEIEQRVAAELKARELAEHDADARYRAEAAERARAAAGERQKQRDEATARSAPASPGAGKPANRIKVAAMALIVLIAAAVGLLHVVPLPVFIPGAQELISQRLQQPVSISSMRYALFPSPQLTLERVTIGKLQEIKIGNIVVGAEPFALLGEQKNIDSAEVNSVIMEQDMLAQILLWAKPQPGAQPLQIARLRIKSIRLPVKALEVPAFDADITLDRRGALQKAVFSDDKLTLELTPKDQLWHMNVNARGWQLPVGPALEFDDLAFTATIGKQQATISGIEGRIGRGAIKGAAKASWGDDNIRIEGDFSLANGDLGQLLMKFTRNFEATGTLNVTATYALQGTSLATLFGNPRVNATFAIAKGALNNIDIVRAIQSPSRDGIRGGKTSFDDLAGSLQLAGNRYLYRQLRSTSEAMSATGNVDVAPGGDLSGHISAELGSKSLVVARGGMNVTGDLKAPVLKP